MFEKFGVPGLYIAVQAVLSLYATGRTTGVVMDSGDGVTHVVPIYDGVCFEDAIVRIDVAGRDLTRYLLKMLKEERRGFHWSPNDSANLELCREIKEKHCYVANDYQSELKASIRSEPVTIDVCGEPLSLGAELFKCPEALFQPLMLGSPERGVHQAIADSIRNCDRDIRQELYNNIVLSGGSTCYPNFEHRLQSQLEKVAPSGIKIRINAEKYRKYLVWIGGAVLSSLSSFEGQWITKADFEEDGEYRLFHLSQGVPNAAELELN